MRLLFKIDVIRLRKFQILVLLLQGGLSPIRHYPLHWLILNGVTLGGNQKRKSRSASHDAENIIKALYNIGFDATLSPLPVSCSLDC
jgi:hypothetical protein